MEGVFGGLAAARPPLPPEPALAAQLGVSRNAIREALFFATVFVANKLAVPESSPIAFVRSGTTPVPGK